MTGLNWWVVLRRVCIVFAVIWLALSVVVWTYGANPFERNPLSGMVMLVSMVCAFATFVASADDLT